MPEGTEGDQTVSMAEYQKLQRTLDRRNKAVKDLERQVASQQSAVGRVEGVLESFMSLMSQGDETLEPNVKELLERNSERRKADTTSAELTARLNEMVELSDYEWEDDKFAEARRVLDEINSTGDLKRAGEVEDLIRKATGPAQDERPLEQIVEEAVARALGGNRSRESARVDGGTSTSRVDMVTRGDLATMDPREGIAAMRRKVNQALNQMGA